MRSFDEEPLYMLTIPSSGHAKARRSRSTFQAAAPPGIAVLTTSSTLPRRYAPEQGTRPDTVNRTIKLRLLARPTVPVSTAIMPPKEKL